MSDKKWYAVFTRPRCEKKVADLLTKRGFENYCPLNKIRPMGPDRKRPVQESLFPSFVFVRVTEAEHPLLRKISNVVNILFWIDKPAVIRDIEIDMIYRFLHENPAVKLEKNPVNVHEMVRVISGSAQDNNKAQSDKSSIVRIVLPSLGYTMSAEVATGRVELIRQRPDYVAGIAGTEVMAD